MSENTRSKQIRFIDSDYNLLFYVADGGNVVLTDADGLQKTRPCAYLDDYHTRIGNSVYPICEFAEKMECNGIRYAPELPAVLPELCYSVLPSSGELVVLKKGETGYFACAHNTDNPDHNRRTAQGLNAQLDITPRQLAAMEAGSMFGFNVAAADPNNYDVQGNPLLERDPSREIAYAIYQLQGEPDTREFRFMPLRHLPEGERSVHPDKYTCVYRETLCPSERSTDQTLLNGLFDRFNMEHPSGFMGHSLSVSDVVTITRRGITRAYYVDTVGFTELPSFRVPDPPLRTAELSMEQNANQIDGRINNLPAVKDQSAPLQEKTAEQKRAPKHTKSAPER